MSSSVEIRKSKSIFTLQDVEDLCAKARGAGALGTETFYIRATPGDRPFDSGYTTLSISIQEDD